tara:strand:+ start:993 stop:1250 length:258 start_codon:yes stop_codon:yes gene_type:complete
MPYLNLNPLPYGSNQEFANKAMLIGASVQKVKKPCFEQFQSNNIKKEHVKKINGKNKLIPKEVAYSNPLAWSCYCENNNCYCPML